MALPKLYRAFNMKINCSSDIDFCHAKSFAWFVMRKMNKKCFLLVGKNFLQILTSKRCIEWPKLYFLLLVKGEHLAMKIKLIFQDVPFCHHVPLIAEFLSKHSPPFHQRRPTDQLHRSQMPANTCSNVRNASVGHQRSCPVQSCSVLSYVNVFHDLLFSFRTGNVSLLLTLYAA